MQLYMVGATVKIVSEDYCDDFVSEIALAAGFESFDRVIYETGEEALWNFVGYIRTDDPAGIHARLAEDLKENCDGASRVYTKWFKITPAAVFDTGEA